MSALLSTYKPADLAFERGEGAYLIATDGRRYLDFAGGIAVNVGARIAAVAAPSEVLVSYTVHGLVSGSGLEFADAGEHELKGVPDRWRLYRVRE